MWIRNATWLTVVLAAAFAAGCTPAQQTQPAQANTVEPQVTLDDISAPVDPVDPVDPVGTGATAADGTNAAGERIHTVVRGDTIYSLARKYYNDDITKWRLIAAANKEVLPNPNVLTIGARLVIPRP